MRISEILCEADLSSPESQKIVQTLNNAGYKMLGSGADATVWKKNAGQVIKIIMPEEGEDATTAAKTFYRFYEFCQSHSDYQNLPKFVGINGQHHSTFVIDDKEFVQISMEQLQPIHSGSFAEAMVWILSEYATQKLNWKAVLAEIKKPSTWEHWSAPPAPEDVLTFINHLDAYDVAEYGVLFSLMQLLYHTGRINKLGWDLHTENVMQRKDGTLVIVDPWFAMEG